MCLPPNYKSDGLPYSPSQSDSYVKFSKGKKVESAFFKTHLEAAAYMCNVSRSSINNSIANPCWFNERNFDTYNIEHIHFYMNQAIDDTIGKC